MTVTITNNIAIGIGTPFFCNQNSGDDHMTARNTDKRNGTKMDSAACSPATMTITHAAANKERPPIHDPLFLIMRIPHLSLMPGY